MVETDGASFDRVVVSGDRPVKPDLNQLEPGGTWTIGRPGPVTTGPPDDDMRDGGKSAGSVLHFPGVVQDVPGQPSEGISHRPGAVGRHRL